MKTIFQLLIFMLIFVITTSVSGQITLKNKLKKIENSTDQRTDQGIEKSMDKAQEALGNIFKKKDKTQQPQEQQTVDQNQPVDQNASQPAQQVQPSMETYSKYDFIPGEKVIYYDDFTQASVGDFPANWNTNASGEVVTTNLYSGNWFKMMGSGSVGLEEGLKLPDNYTIEFNVVTRPSGNDFGNLDFGFYIYQAENPKNLREGGAIPGTGGIKIGFGSRGKYSAYMDGAYTLEGYKDDAVMEADKSYRLSFWVQKTRLRVYLDQVKIYDLPKVFKVGFQANMVRFELSDAGNPMISNFRIAAGLPDMRNKLLTDGKLVTYGIYFDVNKDVVKPESYGTLKEISKILNEVPDVKVKIVGHTDADGADAANLDLSKRRAASVKSELAKSFGVNADRLVTDGAGETQPVAPNDTPVNKAQNRRVEFIKL